MNKIVTVFFKGVNGIGSFNLPITPGQFGARILTVQKIAEGVSTTPSWVLQDVTSGEPFGTAVGSTGGVGQTASNDWSDVLFVANVELL